MNSEFLKSENSREGKEEYWRAVDMEMDDVGDRLGKKIDSGIRETVVALNVIGLPPEASCEGHLDRGCPHPWIDIEEPNEPERYKSGTKQETDEYKRWEDKNRELRGLAKTLIEEFYSERNVSNDVKIGIRDYGGGRFRIQNGDRVFLGDREYGIKKIRESKLAKDLTPEERKKLEQILPELRAEMDDFADFIKEKYLNDEDI